MAPGVYGPDDQQSISNAGEFSLKRRSMSRRTMLAGLGGFALTAGIAGTAVFHGFGITKTPNDDAFLGSSIAASPTADISGPATMQRLVINVTSEPKSFDFNKDPYCGGDQACFARLCQFDENMLVKPDIAEKWESNWDASVWTFYLRDSKWSNGESVTAHDFEYSFKRQLDPATKSPSPAFLYRLKNGEAFNQCNGSVTADDVGVVATDDKTLLVTLENPYVYFPVIAAIAASTPAYQPAVEQHGDTWTEPENIVCNGPFVLTEWKHHVSYTLKRNDNYWNAGNITLTEVYRPIFSSDEAIHVYREGQLDIALNGSFDNGPQIQIDDPLNDDYFTFNKFGTWYLEPNVNMAPFDIKEVRLAMAHAVDRETIVNKVLHGLAMPAYTMTPPGMPGHDQNTFSEYTVYDPEQAMALTEGNALRRWQELAISYDDAARWRGDRPGVRGRRDDRHARREPGDEDPAADKRSRQDLRRRLCPQSSVDVVALVRRLPRPELHPLPSVVFEADDGRAKHVLEPGARSPARHRRGAERRRRAHAHVSAGGSDHR